LNNKRLFVLFFLVLAILLITAILSVPNWASYPEWTGFQDKKAWDLLELLIVPIVLAVGATLFSQFQRNTEIQIETERQRESALQSYIDRIKDLIIELYTSDVDTNENTDEASEMFRTLGNIGAAYTGATLQQLDGKRKGMLLKFLYDTHLIGWMELDSENVYDPIIFLGESADFSGLVVSTFLHLYGIQLPFTNLSSLKLAGLDLLDARLTCCNMSNSSFSDVSFFGAEMSNADLTNVKMGNRTILEKTKLCYANVKNADLRKVSLNDTNLEGARYNYKTKFPKGFDPTKAKMVFEK